MNSEKNNGQCGQAAPKASRCGGQATVEYVVVTGVLLALMLIMALFTTTFKEYGERLLELIASDYP